MGNGDVLGTIVDLRAQLKAALEERDEAQREAKFATEKHLGTIVARDAYFEAAEEMAKALERMRKWTRSTDGVHPSEYNGELHRDWEKTRAALTRWRALKGER